MRQICLEVQSFFNYFPVSDSMRPWGIYATSFGQVEVAPYTPYPPGHHPEGHHFDWNRGRRLNEYQILFIHDGTGVFESSETKSEKIGPSTSFILFPGVWHRYRPKASTGWTEYWIELSGPHMDHLRKAGLIDPKVPIYRVQKTKEMVGLLHSALDLVRTKPPMFPVRLGLLGLQLLALLYSSRARHKGVLDRVEGQISRAQALLVQGLDKEVSIEDIARRLGIGYSYFRREFKKQTGFSPNQYRIEVRHQRVKELLRHTTLDVKTIATRLGYHSPYHLSFDFVRRAGMPPSRWRLKDRQSTLNSEKV